MKFLPKINQLCNRYMVDFFLPYKPAHQYVSLFVYLYYPYLAT